MLESLQPLVRVDPTTFRSAAIYVAFGSTLLIVSAALSARRGGVNKPRASNAHLTAQRLCRACLTPVTTWPITPNQITMIGLVLVAFNCGLLWAYRNTFWFGTGLVVALLFDTLDGFVARAQQSATRFGGYLDAVVDRYQEILIYLAIGCLLDQASLALLIISGSLMISYNKARTALEMEVSNKGWPDLLEKPLRLCILCVGLICDHLAPWFLPGALWMLAGLTHFTALQRFARAAFLLRDEDAAAVAHRDL